MQLNYNIGQNPILCYSFMAYLSLKIIQDCSFITRAFLTLLPEFSVNFYQNSWVFIIQQAPGLNIHWSFKFTLTLLIRFGGVGLISCSLSCPAWSSLMRKLKKLTIQQKALFSPLLYCPSMIFRSQLYLN